MKKVFFTILILLYVLSNSIYSKNNDANYFDLIKNKKYDEAINAINVLLNDIYKNKVYDKRIPTQYVSIEFIEKGIDLEKLFNERKVIPFFIEDNKQLYKLHKDIAYCYFNQNRFLKSLQNYFQALRFKKINRDDHVIFYYISQSFKKINKFDAYIGYLEMAYSINPDNSDYQLELARELSKTAKKKKALYYMKQYFNTVDKVNPEKYLFAANLCESINDYLQAYNYYKLYLNNNPDNIDVNFSVGVLLYKRNININEALKLLINVISRIDVNTIDDSKYYFYFVKSNEIAGDISFLTVEYKDAIKYYLNGFNSVKILESNIEKQKLNIKNLKNKINTIKANIINEKDSRLYTQYNELTKNLGKEMLFYKSLVFQFKKINPGMIAFKIAKSYEAIGDYKNAIFFYGKAVAYNTEIKKSTKKIELLKIRLQRGY